MNLDDYITWQQLLSEWKVCQHDLSLASQSQLPSRISDAYGLGFLQEAHCRLDEGP